MRDMSELAMLKSSFENWYTEKYGKLDEEDVHGYFEKQKMFESWVGSYEWSGY